MRQNVFTDTAASNTGFITREPILGPQYHITGYALRWNGEDASDARDNALASLLTSTENTGGGEALTLFLDATPILLEQVAIPAVAAGELVFELSATDPMLPENLAGLQERGFQTLLKNPVGDGLSTPHPREVTYFETSMATVIDNAKSVTETMETLSARPVVTGVTHWSEYDKCIAMGALVCAGSFYLLPRGDKVAKGLNPAQTLVLQLLEMVRKDANVRQLEEMLKHDAALSYKLLQHINSAGFGLGCEIQSLNHAVQVLGYNALYRWLSLLLTTAGDSQSSALMQTAIIRGRLTELLGQPFVSKRETGNLFVVGLFSLLDRLLGVSMEQVLDEVQLPDPIVEALVSRGGMYGPFLAIAEAVEQPESDIAALAAAAYVDAQQVNQAHLEALAWSRGLSL